MKRLSLSRLPRWIFGALAVISFGVGWLFVLPDREPQVDFQFWVLVAWYLITIFFALLGWPSWLGLVGLGLVGFSLSIYANSLITSSQFYFVLCLLAIGGSIVLLRKHRRVFNLLLLVGLIGCAVVSGLDAFSRYTKIFYVLDAPFAWKHWWFEWLSVIGGFAMVCLPISLVLFIRREDGSISDGMTKWRVIKRTMSVLLGTVLVLTTLYAISQREGLMSTIRGTRTAHQMFGWTEMRSKYSAPIAFSGLWMGRQELTINVRSKRSALLDSATWRIDLTNKTKPTETWNVFDEEFTRASEVISREKWLADWKSQQHGRSVELWVEGDRSHPIIKGEENRMKHVWQQFGLKRAPRFYVLARRTGYSSIDLAFNEDGSQAVANEFMERKSKELSAHWLDHIRYRNWGEAGSNVLNDEFAVITADGQWQSRVYHRAVVKPDDENDL